MTPERVAKIFRKIEIIPFSGCWIWMGVTNNKGYGRVVDGGKRMVMHRYLYEFFKRPIQDGKQIDHLCRVRCCVNPEHLEQVSSKENTYRGNGPTSINRAKTHCIYGHAFDEVNTMYLSRQRRCRKCDYRSFRKQRKLAEEMAADLTIRTLKLPEE